MSETLFQVLGRHSTLMAKHVRKGTRWPRVVRALRKVDADFCDLTDEEMASAKASYARLLLRKHVTISNDAHLRSVLSGDGGDE